MPGYRRGERSREKEMSKRKLVIEYAIHTDKDEALITQFKQQVLSALSSIELSEPAKMYWVNGAAEPSVVAGFAHNLSKRQWEIAVLLCKHYSVKRIADKLHISENTVKKHVQNMKKTLQIDATGPDFVYQLSQEISMAEEEV